MLLLQVHCRPDQDVYQISPLITPQTISYLMNSMVYREQQNHDEDGQVSPLPTRYIHLLIQLQFRLYRLCGIHLLPLLTRWVAEDVGVWRNVKQLRLREEPWSSSWIEHFRRMVLLNWKALLRLICWHWKCWSRCNWSRWSWSLLRTFADIQSCTSWRIFRSSWHFDRESVLCYQKRYKIAYLFLYKESPIL